VPRENYELIILIKHGLYPEFIKLAKDAQATTWLMNDKPLGIKVIHYYGIPGGRLIRFIDELHEKLRWHSRISHYVIRFLMQLVSVPFLRFIPSTHPENRLGATDQEIQCNVIDTIFTLRWKQLAIYSHILNRYDFQYIYDTNASSYLDLTNLFAQIKLFSNTPLYAGNIPAKGFISGANRFFDKQAVTLIVKHRNHWNPALLEDVALGKLMKSLNVEMTELNSTSLTSEAAVSRLTDIDLLQNFHFRTKSYRGAIRNDARIMRLIHERYQNLRRNDKS
jgi:hypothetical protein